MIPQESPTAVNTATLARRIKQDEQKNAHKRRFERHAVFIVAEMALMNTSQRFDGVINEISLGGVRFRPASRFLLRRDMETVTVSIDGQKFSGRIRASRPDGYGIELLEHMSEDNLQALLQLSA